MGFNVKYTTKNDDFPSMKRRLEAINGTGVEVGVLKGEHAWLASIHEYGCRIPVTPKMRAWFHYQGVHLSPSTTEIIIPERSFLRAGYDENRGAVMEKAQKLLVDVASGKMGASALYSGVGLELASKIKDYAMGVGPGVSSFTADKKGSGKPLVDTGDMIGGITWRQSK